MSALFELEAVTGRRALRDFSARIGEGSTAVLGPSGSGTSTLLRLLVRLADPVSGRIRFRGADVREPDVLDLRRRAVLVPQVPALLPGTVADNVAYGPRLAGREADVDGALGQAGLDASYGTREASALSVGEQQRVMLARALALHPDVLLLDEPTASLDEAARDAVEGALGRLREQRGLSYVLVTHDPAQAQRLADRVLRIEAA